MHGTTLFVERNLASKKDNVVALETMLVRQMDVPIPKRFRPDMAPRQAPSVFAHHGNHLNLDELSINRMPRQRNTGCSRARFLEVRRAGQSRRFKISDSPVSDIPTVQLDDILEIRAKCVKSTGGSPHHRLCLRND